MGYSLLLDFHILIQHWKYNRAFALVEAKSDSGCLVLLVDSPCKTITANFEHLELALVRKLPLVHCGKLNMEEEAHTENVKFF